MTSFTPGPWRVGKKYTSSVYAGNMQGIRIAACFDDDGEANARLIAAAPELLEALEKIAAFAPGNGEECEIIAKIARSAIARATS